MEEKEIYKYIRENVGEQTCPSIDKIILAVNNAERMIEENTDILSENETKSWINSVLSNLYPVSKKLEEVRETNDNLRYALMRAYLKMDELGIDFKEEIY